MMFASSVRPGKPLGGLLGRLEGILSRLEVILGRLGAILGRLGGIMDELGGLLGRLGGHIEPSWANLETLYNIEAMFGENADGRDL